ncbi:hypothetical protein BFP70_09510 [Thioclava sp. SK-1]|uniref:globin domain-containing protein n=1 Tax=Thioclava sp. SK-1 TaxID=1889770 RepID=UPI00082609B1|nr:globin domain-containing protein [Thioclava sp. SK-1]OCX65296.1 hypothetical protein BFP70_09510 [Thioclava sp. SK-1]
MTPEQIAHVQDSFRRIQPMSDTVATVLYADLFTHSPKLKPMFTGLDMAHQGQQLMRAIGHVVANLSTPQAIWPMARTVAVHHAKCGVNPGDYDVFGTGLLRTLDRALGDAFTPEAKTAWIEAYSMLVGVMIKAAYPVPHYYQAAE